MKTLIARALVLLVFVLACALPGRAQTITTKVVDYGSGGSTGAYTSLAIVNGNPAIAYYNNSDGMLMFARNSAPNGSGVWTIISVDIDGDVGASASLAIVNGNPAISYYDASNFDLKYVRALDASGTSWGTPVTVDGTDDVGQFTSLAVVDGNPAISYADVTNGDLKYVRALDANGTNWGAPLTLDSTGSVGGYASMEIVNGTPAVSYHDFTNSVLKYVRASEASGTSWGVPLTVDSTVSVGSYTSMAIVNGNPAISYYDSAGVRQNLKYVRASDASGTGWGAPVTVASAGNVGQHTSLTVVNGNPAVSYYDATNLDLKYVRANDTNGTTWATAVTVDSVGDVGWFPSMAIVNGNPAISYADVTNGDLKFVLAGNPSGTSWAAPAVVDSGTQSGDVGTFSSPAMVSGNPAISYFDRGNFDLKYVRASAADGTSWGTPVTVDSVGDVGWFPSLAIVNGNPAIAYYDNSNADLKYVRANDANGTSWGTPMTVASSGSTGSYPSLAFVNGSPAISYYDNTSSAFKYIRADDAIGTTWGAPVTLASASSTGSAAALVVVNGNPAVSYTGGAFDLIYMRANDPDGTSWGTPVTLDSIGNVGQDSSLVVLNGNPAISYVDNTNGNLKFVRASDSNGTSWGTPVTVDSINNVGWSSSLGIVRGKPAISYWDATTLDIKYVRALDANGTNWGTPLLVDGTGDLRSASMLVLNVNPAISYYDATNRNLKWASLVYPSAPEIAVEQPAGNALSDGTGSVAFGLVNLGSSSAALTFTIRNPGTADLTGLTMSKDGTNANDFSVSALSGTGISVGTGTVTFTVIFNPGGIGPRSAAIHIGSNVSGSANPFDITLTGYGVSNAPLSGTKTVGPTGTYASVGSAIFDIESAGLAGALVLELQPAYVSAVETFPLIFTNLGTTPVNTLTIRPASGATALSITSADTTAATVDLRGAQFVTIDGRPGGVGSNAGSGGGAASELTIANTSTSGVAVRFINEASGNTLRYTTLRGVNSSATSGVVVFSTTTGGNGNDNNTIDHCDIRDGASTPTNGIYALGTTTTTAANNSGNTVSNCNVLNFYAAAAVDSAGVRLDGGNTDWTLTGNSFYQSASRAAVSLSFSRPIYVNNTSGNNFTVTGNFIGGSAPNAGDTAWTTTGTANAYQFVGIHLNVGNTTASSVQGNTIQNIAWTTSSNSNNVSLAPWIGIFVSAGSANVGTVTGNTIGSGTGTGSISVTTSGTGGTTFGIGSASTGTVSIAKNTIGSITTNGTATTISASLVGIQVTAGANTISNNLVGSLTTANSLNAATSSTSGTGQQVAGIVSSSSGSASLTGNTLANLNNNYIGTTTGQVRGIATTAGVNTINGNTVRNFSSINPTSLPPTSSSVLGIIQTSTVAGQTVSRNVVHSLSNTAATGSVSVIGIYYAGNTTAGPNIIAQNLVHSLAITSTSLTTLEGMEFAGGTFTAQNNMVRVGLDANGVSTGGGANLRGIYDNGTTAGRNFYHNSVYSAGTQTNGANATIAFQSTGVTNAREFRNNIFVSTRTRGGTATSSYVAVTYGGTTANPAGLTASNNIFFVSGTGSLLGIYNGASISTLSAWQAATGMDTLSLNADPVFVNPTGSAATVDLHVQGASPANSAAAVIATVTDDMDSQARNATFPDIGADEFDANEIGVEQPAGTGLTDGSSTVAFGSAPVGGSTVRTFTVRNIGNLNLTLGTITGDGTDAAAFTVNTAGMSTTLPPGGSTTFAVTFAPASAGAKTAALHIASNDPNENPFDINLGGTGTTGTPLSGTKTIGPSGNYPSIGNAIANIQTTGVGGPLVLELQAGYVSTVEAFPLTFTNLGSTPANTITLRPASGAASLSMTSANTTATVDLNSAQFVTIDGRPGGTGTASQLTIANTSTSGVALRFINDASGNTIQYTTLTGVNTSATSGTIVFSTSTGVNGNDNNTINNCDIRDGASTPTNGVYSFGTTVTTAANNSGNTVSNCNIFNFYASSAVDSAGVRLDDGSTDWTISGNSFYQTLARVGQGAQVRAINVNNASGNNFTVTGNVIGGTAPNAGGAAWPADTSISFPQFQGIRLNVGTLTPSSVQGNTVSNMVWKSTSFTSTLPGQWIGIHAVAGSVNIGTVTGNTIGSGVGNDSISIPAVATGAVAFGIGSSSSGTVAITNNVVGSITMNPPGTNSSPTLIGIQVTAGTNTISGNTVGSTTTTNSLNVPAPSTNATFVEQVTGILSTSATSAVITNNIVANLNSNYAGTVAGSQVRGIVTTAGVNTITGNTVRNLSTTSPVTGTAASSAVLGIAQTSTASGQTVSQNVVHSLANTAAAAGVKIIGIYYACSTTTGPNLVARNLVHSLDIASTDSATTLSGMYFSSGSFTAQNNMVRVGLNAGGTSTAGGATIHGILDNTLAGGGASTTTLSISGGRSPRARAAPTLSKAPARRMPARSRTTSSSTPAAAAVAPASTMRSTTEGRPRTRLA